MSLPVNPQAPPNQQGPANTDNAQVIDTTHVANIIKILHKGGQDLPPEVTQQLHAITQGLFGIQSPGQHQIPHAAHQIPVPHTAFTPGQGIPGLGDPGPSSHPRGPPNLGQLSAAAAAAVPTPEMDPGPLVQDGEETSKESDDPDKPKGASTSGRSRGNRNAAMGTDEWARQRKDNHKEVERRRRGNINEGITELGRIVPNSSGEKAKGAILARAVQYIHHLKENEARNIEKWTLEKLLMDQAMGDLQAQLEEMRRLWEEERAARQRAESELEVLRGVPQCGVMSAPVGVPPRPPSQPGPANYRPRSRSVDQQEGASTNEARTEVKPRPEEATAEPVDRPGKRPRVE
ncbi:hypothetical protein EV363DRAFT_1434665 [Boletus edulis]|uniref:BHLH domain-containing protein n=1 Tax=Boletus edulis BED1 TaxID=1328754 RepID=A0AAD4BUL1_BOLED|nr:hypothetical protein EV363DRAFT_1434665 [Boletus edulis]KAF8440012.1 hypothetical protein L210DRAFT_3504361 [Boletus edulis BED1]